MSFLKALGYLVIGCCLLLGLLLFCGIVAVAWPVLLVLLIFGIPFIIVGIIAGKKDK